MTTDGNTPATRAERAREARLAEGPPADSFPVSIDITFVEYDEWNPPGFTGARTG